MPIANCIISSECQQSSNDLVKMWAAESGQSAEHMTVNIIISKEQIGKKYGVVATLFLPSVWSDSDISSLQTSLAKVLANHFSLPLRQVLVISNIVNSGMVVENGQIVCW